MKEADEEKLESAKDRGEWISFFSGWNLFYYSIGFLLFLFTSLLSTLANKTLDAESSTVDQTRLNKGFFSPLQVLIISLAFKNSFYGDIL